MQRIWIAAATALAAACGAAGVLASATPAPSPLPAVELKYRVFEQVGRPWYCDPDFYPIARSDEAELARQRLPEMQKDADTFAAILRHNGVPTGSVSGLGDAQLLAVYRDWKDLQRLELTAGGQPGTYAFAMLVRPAGGAKQSEKVEGRVDAGGRVSVLSRAPGGFLNCPICLASTTRIDTPHGPVPVTDLRVGDVVWTRDERGARVPAAVLEAGSMDAPAGHEVVRVQLADGRDVAASPGHPTADGRQIGSLILGDALDGSTVIGIERLPYRGRTYDLLPAGPTGTYWADGVLLGSTLGAARER